MSRLYMIAGAIATRAESKIEEVSAYVVLAEGVKSRLFKIVGEKGAPRIEEIATATTLDLKRFQDEVKKDLVEFGPTRSADKEWACDVVRVHLRLDLGL
jgi:hypothetical protein